MKTLILTLFLSVLVNLCYSQKPVIDSLIQLEYDSITFVSAQTYIKNLETRGGEDVCDSDSSISACIFKTVAYNERFNYMKEGDIKMLIGTYRYSLMINEKFEELQNSLESYTEESQAKSLELIEKINSKAINKEEVTKEE